ncbi:hypothetical protein QBC34DRAFT_488484 [Podospora aff. communis PSN243]|uniref:Heterokaryon incompatibility domain-containing protein n=1 Tax=Podospora aff. communis PSN243 TaxID=3040156 RepID=A0AAV9G406_9PEZI|nr:hypothetical protein QBC34DRAFT_488484 [Podospora aff. communis PSN243]
MNDDAYEYLPLEPNEIRILHLRPGEKDDSIFIEITHEKLNGKIKNYSALSWQWGTETATQTIRIKHNGKPTIWRLRPCAYNKEKSMQIALMTKIYGMAKEVCVWLGEAGDGSRKAMEFVNKLVDLDDENHIAGFDRDEKEKKELAEELDALIRLLKRGWFSRRWVVQEIAMARRATLHCGADKVPWSKLADAIALLEKVGRDGTINRTLKQHAPKQGRASEYVGSFSSLPAYRLVQNTTGMFRGQDKKDIRTWRYTLEELISFLAAFQASRLHDTVYALLGLASDAKPAPPESPPLLPPAPGAGISRHRSYSMESVQLRKAGPTFAKRVSTTFEVDYSLSPLAVFKQFLEHAIGRSQSLDIICRPWAPEEGFDANGNSQTVKLPSWIPSLNRKPFRPTRHGDMVRFNPDPLVGPASFRHRFYQASGPGIVKPKYRFLEGSELELQGFEVGEIGQAWDAGTFGNVPATWLRAGGWKSEADPPPDDLWRALVADRNGMGDDPDRWYPMVFQTAAKDRGINYGFETHRLIHESTNARVAELFRRVQAVVWDRRLITVTGGFADWLKENEALSQREEQGALGLSPCEAQIGDKVCIIFGCSVPLVLRKIVDTDKYVLIGECYLDHTMDGEAMTYFEKMVKGRKMVPDGTKFTLR